MTIKQYGGVFGRNPTFNDVTIEGQLTFDGDIDINSDLKVSGDIETIGNVIIATSGNGIDFSATAGTGTSELFDDYEEGTWTPVLNTDNSDMTISSYVIQTGRYTKSGNTVVVTINLAASVSSVGTGTLQITGLPYTADTDTNFPMYGGVAEGVSGFSTAPTNVAIFGGSSNIRIRNTSSALSASDITTGTVWLRTTITYRN